MDKKRIGFFMVYDPEGIVDEYIEYLLDDITPLFTRLVIVCNGFITPGSREILEKYTDLIFVRENKGYDFSAWKEAMFEYYGYSGICEFDELVLFNDSFFGPFRPFLEIFKDMDERKLDFWGLSVHGEAPSGRNMCVYGYRPRYIQTYFMVFGRRMLNDEQFILFWRNIPVYKSFLEISENCSAVLTKYFSDCGYRWGVYSDTADLEESREKNICHHAFDTEELIANRRYPIIKRKSFVLGKQRFLQYNSGLDLPKTVKYIRDNKLYDMGLIMRHILRRYDIAEIKESLNLSFVTDENRAASSASALLKKAAVCIHIAKADNIRYLVKNIQALKNAVTVFVFGDSEACEMLRSLQADGSIGKNIRIVEFTGTYIECLLSFMREQAKDYKYMAFTHDPDLNADDAAVSERTAKEWLWDNTIRGKEYLANLLLTLEEDEYLGFLNPTPPMHGHHYTRCVNSGRDWNQYIDPWNYVLGNAIKKTDNRNILSVGCSFVCKTEALRTLSACPMLEGIRLFSKDIEYSSAFDNCLPYIVQKNGYLSGWCMSREYASAEIETGRYMMENAFIPNTDELKARDVSFPIANQAAKRYANSLKTRYENALSEQQARESEQDHLLAELNNTLAEKEEQLVEYNNMLIDREHKLVEYNDMLVDREHKLVEYHNLLAENTRILSVKERKIRQLKIELKLLHEYYDSLMLVQVHKGISRIGQNIQARFAGEETESEDKIEKKKKK